MGPGLLQVFQQANFVTHGHHDVLVQFLDEGAELCAVIAVGIPGFDDQVVVLV
jgi:hypothetical protein